MQVHYIQRSYHSRRIEFGDATLSRRKLVLTEQTVPRTRVTFFNWLNVYAYNCVPQHQRIPLYQRETVIKVLLLSITEFP